MFGSQLLYGSVASPVFGFFLAYIFGLGLFEVLWFRHKKLQYNWTESLVSIADMFIRRGVQFAIGGVLLMWVGPWFHKHAIADLPIKDALGFHWGRALGLFIGLEFFYYWNHRWSHEVRWFWATHAVHHSPNSMNFMTAERLGWTQSLSASVLVFTPLMLAGFRPEEVLGMLSLNLLYQYWLHTEMIGKLGWFEWAFNTPSHHRVHHGSNPKYLDCNYGGILIVFDRLFGSFVEEDEKEKVIFGLVKPLYSKNPIYIALHEWINILTDVKNNWRHPQRLPGYLVGRPGWSHDGSRETSSSILVANGISKNRISAN